MQWSLGRLVAQCGLEEQRRGPDRTQRAEGEQSGPGLVRQTGGPARHTRPAPHPLRTRQLCRATFPHFSTGLLTARRVQPARPHSDTNLVAVMVVQTRSYRVLHWAGPQSLLHTSGPGWHCSHSSHSTSHSCRHSPAPHVS